LVDGALALKPKDTLIATYLDNLVTEIAKVSYGTLSADVFPEEDMGERYLSGFETIISQELASSVTGKQVVVLVSHEGGIKHLMKKYFNREKPRGPDYCTTFEFKAVSGIGGSHRVVSCEVLKY
jgi:hypothetical protein